MELEIQPKIFISYSWTTPNHEDWVINLAEKLMSDGVEVIIDKWYLKEGNDKFTFMETMVNSKDITNVLLILDKKYSEKANLRSGGVGTETQIISPQIYSNVSQEKFIPIVAERDEEGNGFFPTFLEGRIYIDLSSNDTYEENYETLLRNVFKRPVFVKPKLGKAPSYLFDETPMTFKTSIILRGLESQLSKNPKRINSIISDFLEEFYQNLETYSITFSDRNDFTIGKEIYDNVLLYTPLRNDFIYFFEKVTKKENEFDIEILIKFLEKLPLYKHPIGDRNSWSDFEFDNYRFFIHELFLYLITVGLKNENYNFISELLYSSYFLKDKYNYDNKSTGFECFSNRINTIDVYYKQTFSSNFYSTMADLIIKRIPDGFTKDLIIEADLLCHYISVLKETRWFPITYVYKSRGFFDLFDRMISLRHFEKVKTVFNINTIAELKDILVKAEQKEYQHIGYTNGADYVIPFHKLIDKNKIGTAR
jgi:TIR domain